MDDLDGTGQETPRAHAAPPCRSGVDRLCVRSTDCSARDNALSGTAMLTRRHPRMPVAAQPGIFVHFSHVMNTTAPAAIPGRRPSSAGAAGAHIAHCTLHARTAPIPLPSAESSASHPVVMHTAMPAVHARAPAPPGLCGLTVECRPANARAPLARAWTAAIVHAARTGAQDTHRSRRTRGHQARGLPVTSGSVRRWRGSLRPVRSSQFECLLWSTSPCSTKRCADLDGVARISEAMHLSDHPKALQGSFRLDDPTL